MLARDKVVVSSGFPCRGQRTKSNAATPDACEKTSIFAVSLNMKRIREAKHKKLLVNNKEQKDVSAEELLVYKKKIKYL